MKFENKFSNKVTQTFKETMFSLLVYAVLIVAIFFYAALSMIKLWALPVAVVMFTINSVCFAYEDNKVFKSYTEAFNHRLVELVTWYIEVGTK